jgi:hypothetical protein
VTVVYADRFTPQAEKARAGSGEDARSVPFLKRFTVFNVAQCECSERPVWPILSLCPSANRAAGRGSHRRIGRSLRIGGAKAFYVPAALIACRCRRNRPFRADQLLPHGAARIVIGRAIAHGWIETRQSLRQQGLCPRGTGRVIWTVCAARNIAVRSAMDAHGRQ